MANAELRSYSLAPAAIVFLLALFVGLTSATAACHTGMPAKPAPAVAVFAGFRLAVRMNTTLSTRSNRPGSTFSATLVHALKDGEHVLAPQGAQVAGRVLYSDPGGVIRGRAMIAVQLTRIHDTAGHAIPIETHSIWRSSNRARKRNVMIIGSASGTGAAIGALAGGGIGAAIGAGAGAGVGAGIVLLTRSTPAEIRAESILTFRLRSPASL